MNFRRSEYKPDRHNDIFSSENNNVFQNIGNVICHPFLFGHKPGQHIIPKIFFEYIFCIRAGGLMVYKESASLNL